MSPHRPENDETLEALANRLRRLPPPPMPPGLEGRLLATIPAPARGRALRSRVAAAVLLAAAAAAFFVVRLPRPEPPPAATAHRPADRAPTFWRYEQALRGPDADASVVLNRAGPTFEWPVAGPGPSLLSGRLSEPSQ